MAGAAALPARGLVRYDPRLDGEILRFNRDAYPERRTDLVEPRWRWMFLDSARRLGADPMVWMYRAANGIVAHQGAIPVRLWVNGTEIVTGWFVETMVLESHRGKAIGPMTVRKALEDLPLNLSLGQTSEMRTLQFRLGWVEVAPLDEYLYVLDASAVLVGKVPLLAKPLLAAAIRLRQWLAAIGGAHQGDLTVRAVTRFASEHDRFWKATRHHFTCAVVRDAAYLNWKYVHQPGQTFTRLEVRRGDEVVGVVVVKVREDEAGYRYRRGFIVEYLVDPSDAAAGRAALRAACQTLRNLGAAMVRCDLLNAGLVNHLLASGFFRRGAERVLLVSTETGGPELAAILRKPEAWLLTGGDSDIDRPW